MAERIYAKKKIFNSIVSLVMPPGMSLEEYVFRCATNGIDVSPDDLQYVMWLLCNSIGDNPTSLPIDKIRKNLVKAVGANALLSGFESDDAQSAMIEFMTDMVLCDDVEYKRAMFEAVLRRHASDSIGKAAHQLNRAFGFTSYCYFHDNEEKTEYDLRDQEK